MLQCVHDTSVFLLAAVYIILLFTDVFHVKTEAFFVLFFFAQLKHLASLLYDGDVCIYN